jgi:hypothetical protein
MDWYVFKSQTDSHAAVSQMGNPSVLGWPQIHGPDTFQGCWGWIRANCTGGPNYYFC